MNQSYNELYKLVKKSKLVNAKWYLEQYPDVALLEMDPVEHYLKYGGFLRRNPCKRFDTAYYISQVPELQRSIENPLVHYLLKGVNNKSIKINSSLPEKEEEELKDKVVGHLWGGHSISALAELKEVYENQNNSNKLRAFAAWHSARWYYFVEDFCKALEIAEYVRHLDKKISHEKRFVMLFSFCFLSLGRCKDARSELQTFLFKRPRDTDALLALSNTYQSDVQKLKCINKVFEVHSLKPIKKIDEGSSLSLDNITTVQANELACDVVSMPKVSIIMPIYNASQSIDTAIRGLLEQTWKNIEIIAVDDKSNDDTYEKLVQWAKRDSRVKPVLQSRNQGAYAARNLGLSHATGDYITTHDSDDWSHSQKIETQLSSFKENPELKGVVTYWVRAKKNLEFTQNWRLNSELVHWSHSSFLFKSSILKNIGGWDVVNVGGDTEFIWRIESAYGTSRVKKIHKSIPFSFALDDETSLTRTKSTHVKTIHYGLRHIYRASCKWWHKQKGYTSQLDGGLRKNFPAPKTMFERNNNIVNVDMLLAGDFSNPFHCALAHNIVCKKATKHIALFHWPDFNKPVSDLCDQYFECIALDHVEPVVVGQVVNSTQYNILGRELLSYQLDSYPAFENFHGWTEFGGVS